MKDNDEDPPCCRQRRAPERRRPQRGDVYWYLSKSVFDINRAQWDEDGTDEGRWRVGNVFLSLEHAEHARNTITAVLLSLYQDHA
jgi:hypothetical protein